MPATRVCAAAEVPRGGTLRVLVDGLTLCIHHLPEGFFATDDLCTHGQASLADGYIDGSAIVCPRHFGAFHIPTGEAVRGPCVAPLKTYSVSLSGDGLDLLLVPPATSLERPCQRQTTPISS